jgi:serine/threonine protein kinase
VSYIQRAVMCVRYMQTRLKTFNTENSMNLTLGVSLSHGSANIGLLGNTNNLQFDITCRARDEAFYMCVQQTNSLVVSEAFYDEIHRLREVSNCVYNILDSKLPNHFLCQTWYLVELNNGYFGAIARELEDYHYVGFLGEGGNGSVHLLIDKISKVQVAVKGIHWGMGRSSSINHIRRELRILQQLQHPNIVNFKFCIIRRAKIYIVMEYIRGGTLRQILTQHDISLNDRKIWFAQLVSALGYLHDHGIMHRDVKPSNCMIDTFGRLKLTDFGLALQEEDINGTSAPVHHRNDQEHQQTQQQHGAQMAVPTTTATHFVAESDAAESSFTTNMTSSFTSNTHHTSSHHYTGSTSNTKDQLFLGVTTKRLLQNIFPMRENHDVINSKMKESILVIDSSKYRLNQNVCLLQQAFTVWSANTDDEAIDLLSNRSNHKIDIILMDLSSNENTTGWGFLSQLWCNEDWKETPVIILTELHDITFHSQCWTVGRDSFLCSLPVPAPVDCHRLVSNLESLNDQSSS